MKLKIEMESMHDFDDRDEVYCILLNVASDILLGERDGF